MFLFFEIESPWTLVLTHSSDKYLWRVHHVPGTEDAAGREKPSPCACETDNLISYVRLQSAIGENNGRGEGRKSTILNRRVWKVCSEKMTLE